MCLRLNYSNRPQLGKLSWLIVLLAIYEGSIKMSKGTVKWFSAKKGFGFITPEDGGKDLFVHFSEIKNDGGFATLKDGQEVEFEMGETDKGPCANSVVAI